MFNINKLNNKLKYTEYYSMSNKDWATWSFYYNLDENLANDYTFLNTFKNKIHFARLFDEKKVRLKYIKSFIDLYDSSDWFMLLYRQNITPQFLNKYYKKIKCNSLDETLYIKLMKHEKKLKPEVIEFLDSKRENPFNRFFNV